MDQTTSIAIMAGLVSTAVSGMGIVLNFVLNAKRERRYSSLQDTKIELEAFNAVRAEAELIRKELRLTIQEQAQEIVGLEKENARMEKEVGSLGRENERLQREYDGLKKEHDRLSAQNDLLRRDIDDLRKRLPHE